MRRRALLAAIVPLTAGCFSGTRAQSDEPTETPEPTPTETPEPTPTETSSGDRAEASDAIDTAQDRLKEAVYIYTGGVSTDLVEVSAASSEFDDRSVLLRLSDAQAAIGEAQRAAVTTEQTWTVESLREIQQFLTQATDLQAWLIEGHDAVGDLEDVEDDLPSRADAFEDHLEDVLSLARDVEDDADSLQNQYD